MILGAGIGWWREEFEALGVPFEDRAARTVEALRLMREIWTRPRVTFEGRFWQVREAGGVRPQPVQRPHIPIWIGGHSDAALRRVVEVADGWHPLGLRPPVTLHPGGARRRAVRRLRELASAAGRDPAEIVVAFKGPVGVPGRRRGVTARRSPALRPRSSRTSRPTWRRARGTSSSTSRCRRRLG